MFRNNYDNDSVTLYAGPVLPLKSDSSPSPQLAARPYLPGRVCIRSCQARFSGGWNRQQDTYRSSSTEGTPSTTSSPSPLQSFQSIKQLTTITPPEKCRRTLFLPKKSNRHRLPLWHRPSRPRLRRPRPLQLHETASARIKDDLRSSYSPRTYRHPNRRPRSNFYTSLRQAALWCWITDRWRGRDGTPSVRIPALRDDAGDGGLCHWGEESNG